MAVEKREEKLLSNGTLGIHPQIKANFLSKLFFCWTIATFIKGYKRDLDEDDLYESLKDHDSHILGTKLEKAWLKERSRDKPSLTRAIWKVFGYEISWFGILLSMIEFGSKLAQPLCLGRLMQYYNQNASVSKQEAIIYGSSIILLSFINSLLGHNYVMGTQHLGMKIRVACSSLIYKKSLRLSKFSLAQTNMGKIINLMTNDVGRFDFLFISFHNIWIAPIQIIVVTCLLYFMMGVYALAGIGFFISFIPVQIYLGKITFKYRLKTAKKTDERIRLVNEIVTGIQMIKMFTWEILFAKLDQTIRRLEIDQIRLVSLVKAINASVSIFLNRTSLYFAVLAYVFAGNAPQAYYVFVVSSFYNILRQPLVFHIPQAISSLAETSISIKRIEDFLMLEEVETMPETVNCDIKTTGIFLYDICAKWESCGGNVLTNISLSAKKNELVAILGPVGSGKSSLFQIILKELPLTKGTLDVSGSISYASQEPWLFSGTIKENILFGEKFIPQRYQEVCRVCALEQDFCLLPHGDNTLVGDKGSLLSGGQKTRINLARAVYKDTDIYLLDDPLSAVDMHVGKELYNNCISGFLREKCVVLITHQIQYLKNVNKIYVIKDGVLESCDTFDQLHSYNTDIVPIFDKYNNKEEIEIKDSPTVENRIELKEHKQSGIVKGNIYGKYIRASGNVSVAMLVILLFVITQILASSADYFLTFWVNLEEKKFNNTVSLNQFEKRILDQENSLYLYSSLICSLIFITIIRSTSFMQICMKASTKLYHKMSLGVLNTSMAFFHRNPSGRILNRFSKDTGVIDEVLPLIILESLQILFNVIAVTTLVAVVNPWMLIPAFAIFMVFYWLKKFFLASSQALKRIEATARSPIFSHLSDSIQGLPVIRALKGQDYLIHEFECKQNTHNSAFYLFMGCNRTFGFWLDFQCNVYVGIVIMSLLLMIDETTGGSMGLAITQSLTLTGMLQWGIRQWSEMENQMTAVERVEEYADLKLEGIDNNKEFINSSWPQCGCIQFKNVSFKYDLNGPLILSKINITINAEEKVSIVGRTGAGKSSLVVALFRLIEAEGQILIDNTDIKLLPLHLLRSKMSIIPQSPILLHGTLRRNLDPLDEYKDDQLWAALKEVELQSVVEELPSGLYSKVSEGGCNFSVGEKQLLCTARALLRNNKILILDEATSNVDYETDKLIQNTIRKKFGHCTVLTIAHRLRTVMDSDKIMVLEAGSVVEFDHPHHLLQDKNSAFYQLLTQVDISEFNELMEISEKNYKKNMTSC